MKYHVTHPQQQYCTMMERLYFELTWLGLESRLISILLVARCEPKSNSLTCSSGFVTQMKSLASFIVTFLLLPLSTIVSHVDSLMGQPEADHKLLTTSLRLFGHQAIQVLQLGRGLVPSTRRAEGRRPSWPVCRAGQLDRILRDELKVRRCASRIPSFLQGRLDVRRSSTREPRSCIFDQLHLLRC